MSPRSLLVITCLGAATYLGLRWVSGLDSGLGHRLERSTPAAGTSPRSSEEPVTSVGTTTTTTTTPPDGSENAEGGADNGAVSVPEMTYGDARGDSLYDQEPPPTVSDETPQDVAEPHHESEDITPTAEIPPEEQQMLSPQDTTDHAPEPIHAEPTLIVPDDPGAMQDESIAPHVVLPEPDVPEEYAPQDGANHMPQDGAHDGVPAHSTTDQEPAQEATQPEETFIDPTFEQ